MKRVLVITYFFPPTGGVGVQRVLKFVKYLPRFGWQPTVLTVRNPDYQLFDTELLQGVPDQTKVIRSGTIEPSKIYNFLVGVREKIRVRLKIKRSIGKTEFDCTPRRRLATQISNFVFFPDNRVGWLPFALMDIVRKLRREKFDVIFSTSPPFSAHLVGLIAKFILNRPWVVDFRDLWILDPRKKPSTTIHLWLSRLMEHQVLKLSSRVLTVLQPLCEDLKRAYPDIPSEKFEVITNGFDAEDFKSQNDGSQRTRFSIGHIGSLSTHEGRTPFYFLTALADLKKELPELVRKMSVFFVGPMDRPNEEIIDRIISKFDLNDMVHCIDFVAHSQAIRYMQSFDVLLFLIVRSHKGAGSSRGSISGKLYEYFATGRPILALTEDGPIRDLISESGCGIQADHNDVEQIKNEILNCYNKFKEGRLNVEPNRDFIAGFERKKLTGRLATIFDELSE